MMSKCKSTHSHEIFDNFMLKLSIMLIEGLKQIKIYYNGYAQYNFIEVWSTCKLNM